MTKQERIQQLFKHLAQKYAEIFDPSELEQEDLKIVTEIFEAGIKWEKYESKGRKEPLPVDPESFKSRLPSSPYELLQIAALEIAESKKNKV